MSQIVEVVIIIASVITALGTIIACFTTIHKWILRQNKQDEDIKSIKEEQKVLTTGVLACLKGLKEQGCDGPVTEAISSIEDHLNKEAHK
jgi:hypothetical protein